VTVLGQEKQGVADRTLTSLRLYSISPYSNLTGAPICSLHHVQLLRPEFQSICLVLPEFGPIEKRAIQMDIPTIVSPVENRGFRSRLFRRSFLRDLVAVVRSRWRYYHTLCAELQSHPGIVHIHSRASVAPLALAAARRSGSLSILHIHEPAYAQWWDRWSAQLLARKASAVVCVSDGTRQGYGNWIREHAQVIYNFIESPPLRVPVKNRVPRVVMVARMGHRKGFDIFLEVCRLLRDRGGAFEASMAGGWNSKEDQRTAAEYIRTHQLESVVKDCGVVDDMGPIYAQADLLLLPARRDPLPRVIMEAMGHGIPVVASRVDGIPEMMDEGVTGLLVDAEDVSGFTRAVERLLKDEELRRRMGVAGRERAKRLFAPEIYSAAMLKLYHSLQSKA